MSATRASLRRTNAVEKALPFTPTAAGNVIINPICLHARENKYLHAKNAHCITACAPKPVQLLLLLTSSSTAPLLFSLTLLFLFFSFTSTEYSEICGVSCSHRYAGQWLHGTHHGFGMFTTASGERYVGSWQKGQKHGRGRYVFKGGDFYDGDFVRNHAQGDGVYWYEHVITVGCLWCPFFNLVSFPFIFLDWFTMVSRVQHFHHHHHPFSSPSGVWFFDVPWTPVQVRCNRQRLCWAVQRRQKVRARRVRVAVGVEVRGLLPGQRHPRQRGVRFRERIEVSGSVKAIVRDRARRQDQKKNSYHWYELFA